MNTQSTVTDRIIRVLLLLVPPAMGCMALWLGQDASWDLRNYHFYNPFAFLTGRMGYDIAMGQVATYYNPLMHVPFYLAMTNLPPKAVGVFLGAIQGLNVFPLYAIVDKVIDPLRASKSKWISLAITLLGFLCATNLSETGTSFGDNVISLLVLSAIWLIISQIDRIKEARLLGIVIAGVAGLPAGAAFGLKQPFAVYSVGLFAAFWGLPVSMKRRFELSFFFGLGVLGGVVLTGGFWMVEMWRRFGNPLFPYFNLYFQSPWGASESYRDVRFIPTDLLSFFIFPLQTIWNPLKVGEVPFRDLRIPILYLLLIALFAKKVVSLFHRTAADRDIEMIAIRRFILISIIISYTLWMKIFAIGRYMIVCDFMAPLIIFVVLGMLVRSKRRHKWFSISIFILIIVTLQPGNWSRRPWSSDYFGVQVPLIDKPADTIVVAVGHDPMSYLVPFFPPQVRFLRIQSYMTGPSSHPNALDRLMKSIVGDHIGPLFLIYRSHEEEIAINALQAYGLLLNKSDCSKFTPHIEPIREDPFCFCPVMKK